VARLARDRLDLDHARVDLRHLKLEQALDQARMRARYHDLRAAGAATHLDQIDLDALALGQLLAADLLGSRQHSLALLAARDYVQIRIARARVDAGDHAGQDLVLLALKLRDHHAALRLADALDDDLLGGLGRDAAERLGRDVDIDDVADHR